MEEAKLKLSVLTKVCLVALVVALGVANIYLVTKLSFDKIPLQGMPMDSKQAVLFVTLFALAVGGLGVLIGFLFRWGLGLAVIALTKQGEKDALFLALVIANCVNSVLMASLLLLAPTMIADSTYLTSGIELAVFGGSYYFLSNKDQRSTLYLVGLYLALMLVGVVAGLYVAR